MGRLDWEMNGVGNTIGRVLRCAVAISAMLSWCAEVSSADTIRVSRDGSAAFSVLFDAVAAAASGDTILIAPGVYPETPVYAFAGGDAQTSAAVDVAELTIIGPSADSVIVGPASPSPGTETGAYGIVTTIEGNLRIEGVTLRNVAAGVAAFGDSVSVARCKFVDCFRGVLAHVTATAEVIDSSFEACTDAGVLITGNRGAHSALIRDSKFIDCTFGVDLQPDSTHVAGCDFRGGTVGVQLSFSADALIQGCRFAGHRVVGVHISVGCHGNLLENVLENSMGQNVSVNGFLTGSGNLLLGGTRETIVTTYSALVSFHGNHILNAGALSVRAESGGLPIRSQDFSENYWGTSEATQLQEWIVDREDDPENNFIIVDFAPMEFTPVPTKKTSMGGLKGAYRGQNQ